MSYMSPFDFLRLFKDNLKNHRSIFPLLEEASDCGINTSIYNLDKIAAGGEYELFFEFTDIQKISSFIDQMLFFNSLSEKDVMEKAYVLSLEVINDRVHEKENFSNVSLSTRMLLASELLTASSMLQLKIAKQKERENHENGQDVVKN